MTVDAAAVLQDTHTQLTVLFERVRSPQEDRAKVLEEILKTWAAHVAVEKELVAPVLRETVEGGSDLAGQLCTDHDQVEHLLVLIERRKVNSPDMPELVTQLMDLTADHVARAESSLFPAMRQSLSDEQLAQLGEQLQSGQQVAHHRYDSTPDEGEVSQVLRKLSEAVRHLHEHEHGHIHEHRAEPVPD